MAFGITLLDQSVSAVDASSIVSASVSPAANSLLIAGYGATRSGTPTNPTVSGLSLTWTAQDGSTVGGSHRGKITAALGGASPGSGSITHDCGGTNQDGLCQFILQVTGAKVDGTLAQAIVQHKAATGTGTTASVTLDSTPAADSLLIGLFAAATTNAYTVGSDFTQIGTQQGYASTFSIRQLMQYWINPTDGVIDCTVGASVAWIAVGVEVALATAGGPNVPAIMNYYRRMRGD